LIWALLKSPPPTNIFFPGSIFKQVQSKYFFFRNEPIHLSHKHILSDEAEVEDESQHPTNKKRRKFKILPSNLKSFKKPQHPLLFPNKNNPQNRKQLSKRLTHLSFHQQNASLQDPHRQEEN